MDVNSLYTNIEISLRVMLKYMAGRLNPDASRPDEALLQLLEISLVCNNFVFQDKFYLQVKGTAMGKMFPPAYANIYMAEWQQTTFQKCHLLPLIY